MIKGSRASLSAVVLSLILPMATICCAGEPRLPSQSMPKLGLAKIRAGGELELIFLETAVVPETNLTPVPALGAHQGALTPVPVGPSPAVPNITESRVRVGPGEFWVRQNGHLLDAKAAAKALSAVKPVVFAELGQRQELDGFYLQIFKPDTIIVGVTRVPVASSASSMLPPVMQLTPGAGALSLNAPGPGTPIDLPIAPVQTLPFATPRMTRQPKSGPPSSHKPLQPAPTPLKPKVEIERIDETRSTEDFLARLEVVLKVSGADLNGAVGFRYHGLKVVDDTGINLAKQGQPICESGAFNAFGGTLRLRLPSRKATRVKEVSGVVEALLPDRDPQATVRVAGFVGKPRLAVSHPSLVSAGVKVTIVTKREYDRIRQAVQEKPEGPSRAGELLGRLFAQVLFGRGGLGDLADDGNLGANLSENGVIVLAEDPNHRLANIDFFDKSGEPISTGYSLRWADHYFFDFPQKLRQTAVMRIVLATPRAIVAVPFTFKDVPLP